MARFCGDATGRVVVDQGVSLVVAEGAAELCLRARLDEIIATIKNDSFR